MAEKNIQNAAKHAPQNSPQNTALREQQHAPAQHGQDDSDHVEHRIVQPSLYLMVFLALMLFTALTTGMAFVNLGVFNPIIALAIACTKAVLVILFFMHVKYSSKLTKLTVASGFFTFGVFITLIMTDYISRAWGLW